MDSRDVIILFLAISHLLGGSKGCEENPGIRLVGGQNKFEGLVEVCQDGQWKTVCNPGWDNKEARVVCRQLGFADTRANRVINARWKFGLNSRSSDQAVINVTWRCSGRELRLLSCTQVSTTQSTCTDAGVYCYGRTYDMCQNGELRLAGGDNSGHDSGRVEVCLDGFWGTVCDDGWDMRDATTVCRQLELSDRGVPTRRAFFGEGRGPVHLSRAECTGRDSNLLNCTIDKTGVNRCTHSEDAGVICSPDTSNCSDGEVRLMGGEDELEGRVEICYNGVWGTVCNNSWDESDATVVCKQLGFGQPGMPTNSFGAGMGPILLDNVTCNQSHLELLQCVHPLDFGIHNCHQENVAGVICPIVSATTTTIIPPNIATTNIPLNTATAVTANIPPNIAPTDTTNFPLNTATVDTTSPDISPFTQFVTNSSSFTSNIVIIRDSDTFKRSGTVQNAVLFGAVGGALAVVIGGIVLIVVVTVAVLVTKRRKPQYQDATGKGAFDNPIYDGSTSTGAANLDASPEVNNTSDERDLENTLYSETSPGPCYQNTAATKPAESEYEGLYSDLTMNGEAFYENIQNSVDQGTLINDGLHVTVSGTIYGNMPPTLDSDTSTYSALGPTDLNQPRFQNQTVFEDEYSHLQHK